MKFVMLIAVSGGCAAMSMISGFIGQLTNTFNIFNANIQEIEFFEAAAVGETG